MNVSNVLIKNSFNRILQCDPTTGWMYRIGGTIPVNPVFGSGMTINGNFFYNNNPIKNYVLTSDDQGMGVWSLNEKITGGTVNNSQLNLFTNNSKTITITGLTYLPLTLTTPSNNQLIKYNSVSGKYENWTPNYLTQNNPITIGGAVSGTGTTNINVTLNSVPWSKITNAPNFLTGYTLNIQVSDLPNIPFSKLISKPTTSAGYGITDATTTGRTLTINGTSFDLSANRTWSVGTVTSVGITVPSWLMASQQITTSGNIAINPNTGQTANRFLATPNGSTGTVGLRAIVANDLPSIPWSKISSAPTFLTGYTLNIQLSDLPTIPWSKLSSQPTTLAGYGITNAITTGRTLSINGNTFDLSANRSWSVGSVTSVGLVLPSWLSGTAPITTSGNITIAATSGQTANKFLATPSGTTGALNLRSITTNDLPLIPNTKLQNSALTLLVNTSGTDFNITGTASLGGTVTFNLPSASLTNRGVVTTGAQTFAGLKTFNTPPIFGSFTTGSIPYIASGGALTENNLKLFWDATYNRLGVNTKTPSVTMQVSGNTMITRPPTGSTKIGTLSVGGAAFDGVSVGKFTGSANGTTLAVNESSSFNGNLLDFQINGVSKASMDVSGTTTLSGHLKLALGRTVCIKTGSNGLCGTATLVGGTVNVATTAVRTGDIIMLTYNTASGTLAAGLVASGASIINGVSFTIRSVSTLGVLNALDTSTVNWWIVRPY